MCLDSLMCDQLLQIVFSMPPCFYHGAHSSFMELPQSCGQKSLYVDPLMGVQLLQIVPAGPLAYYHSRVVPLGAHLSFIELPPFLVVKTLGHILKSFYVDPLMCVQLLQIVFSMPSCLLPQQSCAPWGSFGFYGAPLGSCGEKLL